MRGASGLFGVALARAVPDERFHAFIDGLELFGRGYSWGGYESLLIPSFPERKAAPCRTRVRCSGFRPVWRMPTT